MSTQQYSHLLHILADLSQQMTEGFASLTKRLDQHDVDHNEHRRNFASINEILLDITNHLPIEARNARR